MKARLLGLGIVAVVVLTLLAGACSKPAPAPPAPAAPPKTTAPAPAPAPAPKPTVKPPAPAPAPAPAQEVWMREFRLPWVASFTGPFSPFTIDADLGVQMAIDEINQAGGIAGRKVILEKFEAASDPAQAVPQTKKAAPDRLLMLGPSTSGDGATSGPTAAELKIPWFGGGTTAATWVISKENRPWTWALYLGNYQIGATVGQLLMPLLPQVKRVAVILETKEKSSIGQWEGVEASLKPTGVQIINRTTVTQGDVDFTTQATQAIAAKPDAIMFGCYAPEAGGLIKELRKQGWKGLIIANQGAILVPDVVRIAGKENIEGVLGTAEYNSGASQPGVQKFATAFRAKNNRAAAALSAASYDAVMVFKDVFESLKLTNNPAKLQEERAAFAKAMAGKKWNGAAGPTTWNEDGTLTRGGFPLTYKNGELVLYQK